MLFGRKNLLLRMCFFLLQMLYIQGKVLHLIVVGGFKPNSQSYCTTLNKGRLKHKLAKFKLN